MTRVPILLPGGTVDWVDDQDQVESDQVDRPDEP